MSGVTPEDRQVAIGVVSGRLTWPSLHWRDLGHTDAHAAIVDALIAAGWGPGGAAVRANREALADALSKLTAKGNLIEGVFSVDAYSLADALLSADHLWGEEPGEDPLPWICYGCGGRYAEAEPNWRGHRTVLKPRPASEWQAAR